MMAAGRFKVLAAMVAVMVMMVASAAFAQEKPKIAVYVTGAKEEGTNKALATRMLSALVNSGKYLAVERSEEFLNELDEEHIRQRSGAIDDDQIKKLGIQFSVDFICIADITSALGSNLVSARIVNIETAEVVAIGDTESRLKTLAELNDASLRIVEMVLGEVPKTRRREFSAIPQQAVLWIPDLSGGSGGGLPKPPSSGFKNPAFLNEENYMSLRFSYSNTLSAFYTYTGFSMPLSLYDVVGVWWGMCGLSEGFYPTDENGYLIEYQPKIQDAAHLLTLTYARNVWSRLTVGGDLNISLQGVTDISNSGFRSEFRNGFGFDIGISWNLLRHKMFGNHILGISTDNIFNMIFDTDEKYAAELRFSLLSDFWDSKIFYGADLVLDDILFSPQESDLVGLVNYTTPWKFTHKLGFNIFNILKLYTLFGFSSIEGGFDHYGFAFGANIPGFFTEVLNVRDIEGVVQFVSLVESNGSAYVTFYVRAGFGKYRMDRVPIVKKDAKSR